MKTISLFALLLTASLGSVAQTIYPSGVAGCIARWPFNADENFSTTIKDVSGNNNDGTNNAITNANGWRGLPNQSGAFNGTNSWSSVAHKTQLNPTNITTIALVKFDSFYNGTCQGNNIIYKGFDYSANFSWAMYVGDNDLNCSAYNPTMEKLDFTMPNYGGGSIPSNNFIQANKWYFLATSFNGSTIKYYQIEMDSTFKATNITASYTNSTSLSLGSTTDSVYMGVTQNPPFKYWFNGQMDEVVLFNRALSDSEIESVYDYLYGFATGVNDISKEENIFVTCTNKNIEIVDNSNEKKQIEIIDMSGRVLQKLSFSSKANINLSNLPNQLLNIKIIDAKNRTTTKKVVLQ